PVSVLPRRGSPVCSFGGTHRQHDEVFRFAPGGSIREQASDERRRELFLWWRHRKCYNPRKMLEKWNPNPDIFVKQVICCRIRKREELSSGGCWRRHRDRPLGSQNSESLSCFFPPVRCNHEPPCLSHLGFPRPRSRCDSLSRGYHVLDRQHRGSR